MKVRMKQDQAGCADGITSRLYQKGQEYDLPYRLGEALVGMGAADEVKEKAEEVNGKMIRFSPMDKDMKKSPQDKSAPITSKQVLRLSRKEMLQIISDRELVIPVKDSWREETIARRIIEALGI